jgi:2'-5' RNA ligase
MTAEEPSRKRLFFGIWPDVETRRALRKATRDAVHSAGGKPVPPDNLHLTLAFLHSVEHARLDCIGRAAAGLRAPAFDLELDRIGYWPRSRVLWSAPGRPPAALHELVAELWAALEPCDFAPEQRGYLPHVTLARKAAPPRQSGCMAPITWRIASFTLAESITGGNRSVYRRLEEWPLQA